MKHEKIITYRFNSFLAFGVNIILLYIINSCLYFDQYVAPSLPIHKTMLSIKSYEMDTNMKIFGKEHNHTKTK